LRNANHPPRDTERHDPPAGQLSSDSHDWAEDERQKRLRAGSARICLADRVVLGVRVEIPLHAGRIRLQEAAGQRAVVAGVHVEEAEPAEVVPLDVGGPDVQEAEAEVG
jgi:hypothetical protein